MPRETTFTQARTHLAELCDQVTADREVIIIHRRGSEDVALIAADELSSLMEVAHLLKSPKNAERLLTALNRAKAGSLEPETVADLRKEIGIDRKRKRSRPKMSG